MKNIWILHVLRCLIAFGVSFYFSIAILGFGLVGGDKASFTDIFILDAFLTFLCGVIIAVFPRPVLWSVAVAALPMPLLVQYLVIGGAIESNQFDYFLWLSSPLLIYLVLMAPIPIRKLIEALDLETKD